MSSTTKSAKPGQAVRLDWYTIAKDVMKEWSVILMISVSAVLFSYTWQYLRYTPIYSMTATLTVNSRVATTDVYSNLSSAASTAETFTKVLDSSLMQKKVAKDIGYSYMPGSATVQQIDETNLLEITVQENTPKLTNDVYRSIMKNYEEIAEPLLGDIILTTLIDSSIPTKPKNTFNPKNGMVRSFVIAFFGSIVFLCLLSFLKDTVRREEDIESKLDTTLLGVLAHEKKYKKSKKREEQKTILISDPMVSFRYAESMKKLGSKIATQMDRRGAKTVLVTSVMENEGKSTVSANIALALSKRSNNVLLMDGDFRKPALFKIFDVDPDKISDFGEVLNGKADMDELVVPHESMNLSLILNSVRYPDSTDMIAQDLMSKIMDSLKAKYDYIVIDSSPMALVADTQEWLDIIDTAILVVRQNSSSVRDINDSISMLNRNEVKLLGCIFNNVEGKSDKYSNNNIGHYGRYGKYGKYGKYAEDTDFAQYSDYSRKEESESEFRTYRPTGKHQKRPETTPANEDFLETEDDLEEFMDGEAADMEDFVAGDSADMEDSEAGNSAEMEGSVAGESVEVAGPVADESAEAVGSVAENSVEVAGSEAGNSTEVADSMNRNSAKMEGSVSGDSADGRVYRRSNRSKSRRRANNKFDNKTNNNMNNQKGDA